MLIIIILVCSGLSIFCAYIAGSFSEKCDANPAVVMTAISIVMSFSSIFASWAAFK